ncbi:hypothetical protein [Chitinophaga arvensicola]|uniref:DUF2946 domain-containing protein n=1 Tax=Chitinophaga arvensicola TaxID=29529 RepID=A0A1I0RSM8_9BACT|nr:hypothetical protein [Chitinophaga arvensicola]SEW44166.1 hypothetical protein SAMN04488122_3303 [Chitinophaga arvensicola]
MQKERRYIYKPFQQLLSVLLLLLFLSVPVVQAFHHHHKAATEQTTDDQEDVSTTVNKCPLCEYADHSQGKVLHLSYPPIVVVPLPEPVVLGIRVYARIYKFTLQGFSNKGPPSFAFIA